MLRIKNKAQDLHKAAKTLRRAVSKYLKLRRDGNPEFELTHVRRRCFMRCACKGKPYSLALSLKKHGFQIVESTAFDQSVVKAIKSFTYQGYTYTAKVTVYPELKRVLLSVQVALPSFT